MNYDSHEELTLKQRIKSLEETLSKLNFWYEYQLRLHPIPLSDRKAFPKRGENPYIEAGPFEPTENAPIMDQWTSQNSDDYKAVWIPKDPEILKQNLNQMKSYAKLKYCVCGKPECGRSTMTDINQCYACYQLSLNKVRNEN